jgi:hypothetical protein
MRAEKQMNITWPLKLTKAPGNLFRKCFDIERMVVEILNDTKRLSVRARLAISLPFLQAAPGGRKGIVRIKRQQNKLVKKFVVNIASRRLREAPPQVLAQFPARAPGAL